MKILTCICKSEYQDEKYGKNKRAHTVGKDGSKRSQYGKYCCTVCGRRS